jgi:phage nucleotide-binding protein
LNQPTGYGTQSKQVISRLVKDGHKVAMLSNYGGEGVNSFIETIKWLEEGAYKNYELICIDNISELENQMLTEYGRIGKNDGAPEMLHYNRVQFKIVDFIRRFRAMDTNVIFTAWEDRQDVIYPSGDKYTQSIPRLSGKSVDTVCGLCNLVAKIEIGEKQRYFQLERTKSVYAKDQIKGRKYCTIPELLYEAEKETEVE